ncbi:SAND domain and SAND domain-like-containing protein [Aphelenchoides besseyi]|nr:SAND domain and SAND domain-like-containing protein [Aphelenchoides besseyi]
MLVNEEVTAAELHSDAHSSASTPPGTPNVMKNGIVGQIEDSAEVPTETPEDAPIHEVRCGLLTAKLHMQRFTCPGIHRRCIEVDNKMITPRQFTIQAEKDKQKDWKGSIRFGRYNLRTMMETKALDFYRHDTNCSLKCQSRNYIKNRKSEAIESFNILDSISDNNGTDLNDENGFREYLNRKRSSALDEYVSQTIHSLNNNPLTRLAKSDDHHVKSDDQLSYTTTSGGNSATPSVSSPPSNLHVNVNQHTFEAQLPAHPATSNANGLPPSDANTSQILNHFLEQQMLIQQQPQPPQQLVNNLMQAVNKAQTPAETSAFLQMAMVAMQMNANQQQPQAPGPLGNIVQQLLMAQSVQQNGFAAPPMTQPTAQLPYLNNDMFSVGSLRRVMEDEPTLFWSRMREVGILDELLDAITVSVDRIRGMFSKRESTSEEEDLAARRLSGMANLLDLGAVFGEKIRTRFVQSALESSMISKELQLALALQRKEAEQKLKIETAKRRSQVFESPMLKTEPEIKKMRLM